MTMQECLELAAFMDGRGCPQAAAAWRADAREMASMYQAQDTGEWFAGDYRPGAALVPLDNGELDYGMGDEPEELWWDFIINRPDDGGRVVNFERTQA